MIREPETFEPFLDSLRRLVRETLIPGEEQMVRDDAIPPSIVAAMRNEIQATQQSGELLDIAYKAMATKTEDRHRSVQEFQAAIRDYHSHMESIALSTIC